MSTEIIKIDSVHPEQAFSRCKEVISSGKAVVYPTDTFYAIGVDPRNAAAVELLFRIKGRAADQPILLLLAGIEHVSDWAAAVEPEAERLMRAYWPGPLTLVFSAKKQVLSGLTAGKATIGLRVPGNILTRGILDFIGSPLTGTSANVSGAPSPRTAQEAASALSDKVDLILDGGTTPGGPPSTIVDVSAGNVTVLREGAIKI